MDISKNALRLLGGALPGSAIGFAGCVAEPYEEPTPALTNAPAGACTSCGVITAIESVGPDDYRVTLRMDNGSLQSLSQETQPAFRVGDRVQILARPYPPQ